MRSDGTEGAREPFWSPDSRFVAFFAGGKLQRISVAGGAPETLATVPAGWPVGTWSSNGTILFEVTENPGNEGWYTVTPGSTTPRKIRPFRRRSPDQSRQVVSVVPSRRRPFPLHPSRRRCCHAADRYRSARAKHGRSAPADSRASFASGSILYVRNGRAARAAVRSQHPHDGRRRGDRGRSNRRISRQPARRRSRPHEREPSSSAVASGRSQLRWFDRGGRPAALVVTPDYYDYVGFERWAPTRGRRSLILGAALPTCGSSTSSGTCRAGSRLRRAPR